MRIRLLKELYSNRKVPIAVMQQRALARSAYEDIRLFKKNPDIWLDHGKHTGEGARGIMSRKQEWVRGFLEDLKKGY